MLLTKRPEYNMSTLKKERGSRKKRMSLNKPSIAHSAIIFLQKVMIVDQYSSWNNELTKKLVYNDYIYIKCIISGKLTSIV